MIPLLTRIDQDLAQCTDPLQAAELHAERAAYLARIGDFDRANGILTALRRDFGGGRAVRVSVWIMLVEGIVLYFEKLSSLARDRVFRANAICVAMNVTDLRCLTGAWLAHLEFERSEYEAMGLCLVDLLSNTSTDDTSVRIRAGMILGVAYLYSGDRTTAQYWYESCRQNAVQAGDQASIGAVMYNRAAAGLARLRVERYGFGRETDTGCLDFVDMEMASAWNFQLGTRVASLPHLISLSRARIDMLKGRFAEAIALFEPLHATLNAIEERPNRSSVFADLISCFVAVGQNEDAIDLLSKMDLGSMKQLDADDQLIAFSQILEVARYFSANEMIREVELARFEAKDRFEREQSRLQRVLADPRINRRCA